MSTKDQQYWEYCIAILGVLYCNTGSIVLQYNTGGLVIVIDTFSKSINTEYWAIRENQRLAEKYEM